MARSSKRWTVQDRDGNPIYLTEERWPHIIKANNHPEMADYEDHLKAAIRTGRRGRRRSISANIVTCSYSTICRSGSITLWELYSLVLMSMPRVRRCRTTSLLQLS